LLADKVSTATLGLWLLIPEHLRLGTWDLLLGWSRRTTERVEPRLAMQLVHEAALCTTGVRSKRSLTQRGFALSNGLPFIASDGSIHELLNGHTVAESEHLQQTLGQLRRTSGHYAGKILLIDPHRMRSYSQRDMRRRRKHKHSKVEKTAQVFFALDGDTGQPVCFTTGTPSRTVTQATPHLLELAAAILGQPSQPILTLADAEHFTAELVDEVHRQTGFDLLVPMVLKPSFRRKLQLMGPEEFTPRWAGYATTKLPYRFHKSQAGPFTLFVQRTGERRRDWHFKAFLCTRDRDEVDALTVDYPKRWHIEEFFNLEQRLGWERAGTQNLHIRYGRMTLALVAQTVLQQLRQRLGDPVRTWESAISPTHCCTDSKATCASPPTPSLSLITMPRTPTAYARTTRDCPRNCGPKMSTPKSPGSSTTCSTFASADPPAAAAAVTGPIIRGRKMAGAHMIA